ncbi:MAG: acetyl-CoA decarbonylase/synthase complex subunit alpha/beta, partial [Candidatus Latescibacterota bacterium]
RIIAGAAIRGSRIFYTEAMERFTRAVEDKGEDQKVEFPETAYFLPVANALMGLEVKTLGQIRPVLDHAREMLHDPPTEALWLPYLGDALDSGISTLLTTEIITAIRYLYGEEPQTGCEGFYTDTWLRKLGIQLVDGRMPGFAAILGAAPDLDIAVHLIRELQKRNILIFVGDSVNGVSIVDQLREAGVEMGWDTYIVPFGRDTVSGIYPLSWAIRSAMTFGGLKAGKGLENLLYTRARVHAFGLTLGEVDDRKYALGAGAINMGFPIIADTPIPEIRPSGICNFEHVVHELDYKKIIPTCIEVRGVKVKVTDLPIPVPYAAAFEGETVRKEDMYCQFGHKYSLAFEYLRTREMDEIDDGKIELIGPDVDAIEEGGALPLGILVEVAGRRMQKDFESIMERQFHNYLNEAMGIFHMGQRDIVWMRISKDTFRKGFRLKHFGIILHAQLHELFGEIIDKVQVTLISDKAKVEEIHTEARAAYKFRDERIAGMTDESVDTFYSCTLCQSYAPSHVCIISPERLGLCGAYSWLDGKAGYEIKPKGCNQPVKKGTVIDPVRGRWQGVNEFVYQASRQALNGYNVYSVMEEPMTSCGCFECIMAMVPECNGFMIVNREFPGMTPCGMNFTTLAGFVGGGSQTPGFLGVGKLYVVSKKFISADGGLLRMVWMPKQLKDFLRDKLVARGEELGYPGLIDMIADETVTTDVMELMEWCAGKNHPALTMPSLM